MLSPFQEGLKYKWCGGLKYLPAFYLIRPELYNQVLVIQEFSEGLDTPTKISKGSGKIWGENLEKVCWTLFLKWKCQSCVCQKTFRE